MFAVIIIFTANCILTGNTQDYSVRLTNLNGNSKEGRLEIYYSGVWGTVCDDYFTNASARVACAKLGFGYYGSLIGNQYGAGTGQIWLDDVNCTGSETGIEQCAHLPWGQHNCNHNEDVSINCDCINYFTERNGQISSPNYPRAYANNLYCNNYISTEAPGQKITITFLAFNTQLTNDYVTITCTSGSTYTSPQYSGSQIPSVLQISPCYSVRVFFYTDGSATSSGFRLTYDITSGCLSQNYSGLTGQISSPNYPNAYSDYLDCSNYISVSHVQIITITFVAFSTQPSSDYVTITCDSGAFFSSSAYSGSQIPATLTITSCYSVKVYFHTDGTYPYSYTGFSLKYCVSSSFSGLTGQISSPNYPNTYSNYLDCSNYISVSLGKKITITFLALNTQPGYDYISITCETGNAFTSPTYSGSQIPAVLTIASCTRVKVYFHTDGSTGYTGFNLTYSVTPDCPGYSNFSGPTGQISSPNYPNVYNNYLDCSNYITVPSGQTLLISFLSFNTQPSVDWVTISCETGIAFRSPRYSGSEIPPLLTIASCSPVEVFFHTDGFTVYSGFNLTYNITSDVVIGGITTKPSNAFPRSDKNDPLFFNCTTATKYLPRWTMNSIMYGNNYTITNSTCGVNTSFYYSTWLTTESLGPGSCNLIVVAPSYNRYLLAGSFICTDSTLASARALLAPINLGLSSTKGVNFSVPATDIIKDEDMRISCNAYFHYWASVGLEFIYYPLYSGGPLVRILMLRTYWTTQNNTVSSTYISNASSYAVVKAPAGVFPSYTCNIDCDFYSNISDVSGVSPIVISFSTDPVEVFYWPENITIIGDNNGQICTPALLYCNADSNPPSTYTWTDESNGNVTNGPTITVNHGGRFTCNASNIIKGQHYNLSKFVDLHEIVDDSGRLKLIAIILGAILGAAVLIIIIILIVLLCRKCRKPKRNTASDGGHVNQGIAHQLQPRNGDNNDRYEVTRPNRENDVTYDNTEYENLGGLGRVSIFPTVYEELDKPK